MTCAVIAAAPPTGLAQTVNTFTGNQGTSWHVDGNWDQGHEPNNSEYALIPSGKTAVISDTDGECYEIEIENGATVEIGGVRLAIGDQETGQPTTSIVDGVLRFKKSGSTAGQLYLYCDDWVTLEGAGTLGARGTDYEGRITRAAGNLGFKLPSGAGNTLDIQGVVTVLTRMRVESGRTLTLDDDEDLLTLGNDAASAPELRLGGSGTIAATNGALVQVKAIRLTVGDTPAWNIAGGEIDVADVPGNTLFDGLTVSITLNGGMLDIHDAFNTTGAFSFRGGSIRVGSGKLVKFE